MQGSERNNKRTSKKDKFVKQQHAAEMQVKKIVKALGEVEQIKAGKIKTKSFEEIFGSSRNFRR